MSTVNTHVHWSVAWPYDSLQFIAVTCCTFCLDQPHIYNCHGPLQGSLYFQQHNPVTTAMRDVSGSSPGPIGRGRTSSLTNSLALIDPCHMYQKAPGSEREDGAVCRQCSVNWAHSLNICT